MNNTASMTSEQIVTKELVAEALTINDVTVNEIETENPPQVADKLITRSVLNKSLETISKALKQLDPEGDLFQDLSVISLSLVDTYFTRDEDWIMNNWTINNGYMYCNGGSSGNSLRISSRVFTNPGHYICIINVGALSSGRLEVRLNNEWVTTLREAKEYIVELTIDNPATDVVELVALDVSSIDVVRLDSFGFHHLTNRFYKYLISKVSSMTELNPENYVTQDQHLHDQEVVAAQFRQLVASCLSELTSHKAASNPHNITPELIGAAPAEHTHDGYLTAANIDSTLQELLADYARADHIHPEYLTTSVAYTYINDNLATALESIKVVDPFIIGNAPQAALPSRYAQTDVTPAVSVLVPSMQSNDSEGSLDYHACMVTTNRKELMSQVPNIFAVDSTKRATIPVALLSNVVNFRITFNHTRKVAGYVIHCYGTNKLMDWKVVTGNTTFIHRITNPTNYELSGNDNRCEINFDRARYINSLSFMFMGAYTGDDSEVKLHIELIYADLTPTSLGITNRGYSVCIPDNGANRVISVAQKDDITKFTPTRNVPDTPLYVYGTEINKAITYSASYYPIEVANTRRGMNVFLDKFTNISRSVIDTVETYRHLAYGDLSLTQGISGADRTLKSIYSSGVDSWYSDGTTNQVSIKQTILSDNVLLKGYMLNWRNADLESIPDTWTLTVDGVDESGNPTTVVFDSVDQYYPFYSVEDDDIVYHCRFNNPILVKSITLTMSARTTRPIALNKLFLYLSEYYYAISENTMYLGNSKTKTICLGTAKYSDTNGWRVYNQCIGRSCVIPINNLDMTEPYTEYVVPNPFHTVDIVANVQNYVLTDDEAANSPDAYVANITSDYITIYANTPFRYALSISRTW